MSNLDAADSDSEMNFDSLFNNLGHDSSSRSDGE